MDNSKVEVMDGKQKSNKVLEFFLYHRILKLYCSNICVLNSLKTFKTSSILIAQEARNVFFVELFKVSASLPTASAGEIPYSVPA